MGVWRYSSTVLDFGTRWRWVISFTPHPLYPRGRSLPYPLDMKLGGPQSRRYGRCWEAKISCPCRKSNPYLPSCIPSTVTHCHSVHNCMTVSNKTERMWKWSWPDIKSYDGIFLQRVNRIMKSFQSELSVFPAKIPTVDLHNWMIWVLQIGAHISVLVPAELRFCVCHCVSLLKMFDPLASSCEIDKMAAPPTRSSQWKAPP
jgi:hypothetical protein